jgi:TM2 domain-containing membrane protein YozV
MAINIIYVLISLIFLFLIYLMIKSLIRGLDVKNRNKKNDLKK